MLKIFNTKAQKHAKKFRLSLEAGEHGTADEIAATIKWTDTLFDTAKLANAWEAKTSLLQGCITAFENGRPENLRAFIMSYLELRRADGTIAHIETGGLIKGLSELVGAPVMQLLEKQQDPTRALETLSADMSAYYRQIMLDISLRESARNNSWMVVPVLLAAGADVNAGRGRPLANAGTDQHIKIAEILLAAGADVDLARQTVVRLSTSHTGYNPDVFDATIHAAHASMPKTTRLSQARMITASKPLLKAGQPTQKQVKP